MFIMQNNESRLIKAAKRTIRAEVTLVIIIIVISSWSIYALYKFTTGSDSFFGMTFVRPKVTTSNISGETTSQIITNANNHSPSINNEHLVMRTSNLSQHDDIIKQRNQQLLQQLLAGQRELYANLDSFRSSPLINPLDHLRRLPLVTSVNQRSSDNSRFKLVANNNYPQLLPTQHLANLQAATDRSSLPSPKTPTVRSHSRLDFPSAKSSIDRLASPETGENWNEEKVNEDEDREAAESNRESVGESVVDGSIRAIQDPATNNGDSSPVDGGKEESSSSSSSLDLEPTVDENSQEDAQQTTTQEPSSDGSESSGEDGSENSEDLPREMSGQSIDDEVERMTQPSSGVVHQQERPFDYKSTVQFDDSPPNAIGTNQQSTVSKTKVPPGDQVASFEAPQGVKSLNIDRDDDDRTGNSDLQVDHNKLIVQSGETPSANNANSTRRDGSIKRRKKVINSTERSGRLNEEMLVAANNLANDTKANYTPLELLNNRSNNRLSRREEPMKKRRITTIRAPYEIDQFLNSLNFDSLIGESSTNSDAVVVRYPRALSSDSGKPTRDNSTSIRRFGVEDNSNRYDIQFEPNDITRPRFTQIYGLANGSQPMPSYVTSNDSALQELLSQRQLLDALKYSQLPSPYQGKGEKNDSVDTNTAGSLYHVDHGFMLVPQADMKHSHKSKEASTTKKKKKHKKMKDKKKTTVAFKKGGHKKKKQKKEEKKYLKEKKFKGAKKGKKVSKGKGGAGGKKGKKLYKDKGYKKKGFKKVYHKEEWGNKKSFFDEFRDKDFKKKWKKFDDKYNYAQMKKFQAKDEKGAKKVKHHDETHKKYDKGKWKKSFEKHSKEHKESSKKKKGKKSEGSF